MDTPDYDTSGLPSDAERTTEWQGTTYQQLARIEKALSLTQQVVYGLAVGVVLLLWKVW